MLDILDQGRAARGLLPLYAKLTPTRSAAMIRHQLFAEPRGRGRGWYIADAEMRDTLGVIYISDKHEIIGDVRGFGLLQGVELVKDRETRVPDAATGRAVTARCMELGLSMNIVSVGQMAAIWRIAPSLTVSKSEIERGIASNTPPECRM